MTRNLLVTPGPDNLWLIQPLREKVLCTIKEALLLSSTAFIVSFSTAVSLGRSGVSGAGGYASPLDFSRPTTSGSRKESNRFRRLSVAPLAGVERRGRGTLGSGVLAVGIPDSLPLGSHLIQGSHPFTGVCLQFHQGQSSGGRGSGSAEQGCLRACSASISRLFQPVIHGYESFRGVEAGHRPFHSELEDSADILPDGDTSIRSSLGSSGGLDGVSGLEGGVLAGANAPGFTQVPQVHGGGGGGGRCTSSRYFSSAFPRLRKFLPESWLLCQRFYTGWGYDFVATWTTGCFRHPHASRFSLL